MSEVRYDKELEQYRNLMLPPTSFQEGFRWSSLFGAIFIALLMVPGAMYMGLVAGTGIGQAAQWVTVILFLEVARRAHQHLSRPELYVLFYMATAAMASPFAGLLWQQFYVQSQAATVSGVAEKLPAWYAPQDPRVLDQRSFMMWEWVAPIGLVIFSTFVGRLNNTILGYGLFRLTSDIEKLPFPMAPVSAQGITALAEQEDERQSSEGSWRWRVFSIGGVIGLAFGAVYMGLPTITGAILNKPIVIFPIPWSDFTLKTQGILKATAVGVTWDMGNVVIGMVLPFFAMVGSFIALVGTTLANQFLYDGWFLKPWYNGGVLKSWHEGQKTVAVLYSNTVDFYWSFFVGVMGAIAIAGAVQMFRAVHARRAAISQAAQEARARDRELGDQIRAQRGDIPWAIIVGTYILTTCGYIVLSGYLIDWHRGVMAALLFFGLVYTPLISYVAARLEGMAGDIVDIPMVREAAFILSGYHDGVTVWFLPTPLSNYGGSATSRYRIAELTGTKFWSIWKAELVLVPVVLIASIFFANFIWSLAPIPSARYPFAEEMWEYNAAVQAIIHSSTLGTQFSQFERALKWEHIGAGAVVGGGLFTLLSVLNLPIMLIYGVVRGLNQPMIHTVVPQFIGALIGRFYFERRLGLKWRQYVPVVAAGFSCGMGLITVLCVGVTFLAKAVNQLVY